jgi:hypothetical protein
MEHSVCKECVISVNKAEARSLLIGKYPMNSTQQKEL